jgi:hypothetical protein
MEKERFTDFYHTTICELRNTMCENIAGIKYIDNFEGIYDEYLNQKTLLKYLIKNEAEAGERNGHEDGSNLLDRHKIAACITAAVAKTKLICDIATNDKDSDGYILGKSNRMNEQLGFASGMNCLMMLMVNENSDQYWLQEIKAGQFFLPETNNTTVDITGNYPTYKDSIVRALYYSNVMSGIQTLMLSNIFFLLEEYHKKTCELNKKNAS